MTRRELRLFLFLLSASCVGSGQTESITAAGSIEVFAEQAQPVFAARCANPSCHGNAERPLSIYAVHRYRIDSADAYIDAPLSDEELQHNHLQASVFVLDISEASQCMLLTKPLNRHASVEVFSSTADYDYQRLQAWIETVLEKGGGR